jgi:hypothetical protein
LRSTVPTQLAHVMPVMGRVSCLVSDIKIPFATCYDYQLILTGCGVKDQRRMTDAKRAKWPTEKTPGVIKQDTASQASITVAQLTGFGPSLCYSKVRDWIERLR